MPTAAIIAATAMNTRNETVSAASSRTLASSSSQTRASLASPGRRLLGGGGGIGDGGLHRLDGDRTLVVEAVVLQPLDDVVGRLPHHVARHRLAGWPHRSAGTAHEVGDAREARQPVDDRVRLLVRDDQAQVQHAAMMPAVTHRSRARRSGTARSAR